MERILDMKFIHYLNLFERITNVRTQHCFLYNLGIIFLVPEQLMAKALGEEGKNVKRLSEILEKKVKVITIPNGKEDIRKFILAIVYPIKFRNLEIKENCLIISAGGMQNKAGLIGRNKTRLFEMQEILKQYFGFREVRIV